MCRPKIVVQYPFIPLYRMSIFTRLSLSNQYEFIFWSGKGYSDKYFKTVYDETRLRIEEVPLKTVTIPFVNREIELQFSAIRKLFKSHPDVYIILANPNSPSSWISMVIARMLGSKVLAWSHGYLSEERGVKGWIRKLYYRLPNGHLLYGDRAKGIMIKKGFHAEKLDVIYNSLDYESQSVFREKNGVEERNGIRRNYGIQADDIVLISIGRLMAKLKIDLAIEGLRVLNAAGRKAYLFIIGDGPERGRLEERAAELNMKDQVILFGACHDEKQLSLLYNASDISVVMGKVGLSAMHSLAYGVPVLTNSSMDKHFPEIEAVIEGETGWYFKEDDVREFAGKVRSIDYKGKFYRNCVRMIESSYTPEIQFSLIEKAISKYLDV